MAKTPSKAAKSGAKKSSASAKKVSPRRRLRARLAKNGCAARLLGLTIAMTMMVFMIGLIAT